LPTFYYDNNGNLISKTDPGNHLTNLAYDALNRVVTSSTPAPRPTSPTATTATPAPTYRRPGRARRTAGTRSIGHLTRVSSSASQTAYNGFDVFGNVTGSTQITSGAAYVFQYSYNLANGLTLATYPDSRAIGYTYDALGRVATVNGYASGISYASHGPISQMTLGNTLVEKRTFSLDRLQPIGVSLGTTQIPTSRLGLNFYYCANQALSCTTNTATC